jgi:hypothetical protein
MTTLTPPSVPAASPSVVTRPGERPALAARYAERSVAPAARDAVGARLRSRGVIRLGRTWWPYRGHEVTLPAHGYFRELRLVGGLRIVDSWVGGRARRETTLLGRPLHPALVGPDLARADLAHAALSAMWVPPVLLDPGTARWTAVGRDTASVAFTVGGHPVALDLELHRGGLPRRVCTRRWGDPERDGHHREVPFGADVLEHRTFGGLTVPSTGVLGWGVGTPGPVRELLRFQITALEPVPGAGELPDELAGGDGMSADAAEGEC